MPSKEWICSGTEGFGMKQIGFWVISLAYLSMWKIVLNISVKGKGEELS